MIEILINARIARSILIYQGTFDFNCSRKIVYIILGAYFLLLINSRTLNLVCNSIIQVLYLKLFVL